MSVLSTCRYYAEVMSSWPQTGKHVLATFDDATIVVYQAFNEHISSFAVSHQTFVGCPGYSFDRMTWIKTNFLWMMFRCGWCTKDENQSRVLAIRIRRDAFEEIVRRSVTPEQCVDLREFRARLDASDVRCQWDPDHDPRGMKLQRRAIQLGIKGATAKEFVEKWIVSIEDITDALIKPQAERALRGSEEDWSTLLVPMEKCYTPIDASLFAHADT